MGWTRVLNGLFTNEPALEVKGSILTAIGGPLVTAHVRPLKGPCTKQKQKHSIDCSQPPPGVAMPLPAAMPVVVTSNLG
jgi:hypothetical protein